MKRKILILLSAMLFVGTAAKAQLVVTDPGNMVQSIINSTKEIIETSATASRMLQNFQETVKIYNQAKEYYDKLRAVNNLVRNARRVQQCFLLVGEISDIYVNSYNKMLSDKNYSVDELSAIAFGYTRLLQESANELNDLQGIINPSDLSMTDKDRFDIIERVYEKLYRYRNLTSYYTRKNISVSMLRSRQTDDARRVAELYGGEDSKYW